MLRISLLIIGLILSCSSGAFDKSFIQSWSFQKVHNDLQTENDKPVLQQRIMDEFFVWKGTRYQWGGDSHEGIDCSAFSRRIIYKALHRHLPRTALEQSHMGHSITANQLNVGDLVFFMTKPNVRHVGVYIGKDSFIHASSSHGVMVSKLSNSYWQEHYLTARRVNA